jgi:hypothetical protein
MTRATNSRIAGVTFLLYIAAGITSMIIFGRATHGSGIAEKLASIAQHSTAAGVVFVLGLIQSFCALVLGVTLYAITRDQDADVAMLGLTFRVGEGLIGGSIPTSMALLWLATASGANAPDSAGARTLGAFLLQAGAWGTVTAATFFAVGSTFFSWLLLRGRMIPVTLAWLGVVASVLLVVELPLQGAGFIRGPITSFIWGPMAVFEVILAVWLLVKGARVPVSKQTT